MKIITPPDFLQILKGKFLLLDTNIFIDAFKNPSDFAAFFNVLKENDVTLLTVDPVIIEFLQGSGTQEKYVEKDKFLHEIIDTCLPVVKETFTNVFLLIKQYREEGKDLSVTDFLLGGILMQYKKNLFLMTKDTSDFPTNIFDLETHIIASHRKALQSYGIYSYTSST
jgi:predicted nucleic acid-binding protein